MIKIPKDTYLEKLSSFINDDDKLVTYKWLSKELEIHVNISKELLADYWEAHKNDGITATYMLIGKTNDGGMRVEVVKDVDLEKATDKYDSIVSKHIYSLQKNLTDIETLAGEDKGDTIFGAIKCNESVILSDEELFKRRWGINIEFQTRFAKPNDTKIDEKKKIEQLKSINDIKVNEKNKNDDKIADKNKAKNDKDDKDEKVDIINTKNTNDDKIESKKVSPSTKSKTSDKKITKKPIQSTKTGFNNLFGKVSNQKKTPPSKNEESTDKKSSTTDETNVKNLFDKKITNKKNDSSCSINSNDKKSPEKQNQDIKKSSKSKDNDFDSLIDIDFDSPMEVDETSPPKKDSKELKTTKKDSKINKNGKQIIQKTKTERGTKRGRSQDTSDNGKKRKRILVLESSDESDDSDKETTSPNLFESSELEESVTPPTKRSPSPPVTQVIAGKMKVRKTVDKTHVDKDGYLVTQKVQVMESASEDDEPTPVPVKPPPTKKPLLPSKTTSKSKKVGAKQTTLTSFFTKK